MDRTLEVQLTPRGSGCSIVFGDLPAQRAMPAGSMRGLQLVVSDAHAARREAVDPRGPPRVVRRGNQPVGAALVRPHRIGPLVDPWRPG